MPRDAVGGQSITSTRELNDSRRPTAHFGGERVARTCHGRNDRAAASSSNCTDLNTANTSARLQVPPRAVEIPSGGQGSGDGRQRDTRRPLSDDTGPLTRRLGRAPAYVQRQRVGLTAVCFDGDYDHVEL